MNNPSNDHWANTLLFEMATALHAVGEMDTMTMREYEKLAMPPIKSLKAKQIKQIRLKEKVSQAVFAKFLNISHETVKKWEQGVRQPTGASLKLLNLVAEMGLTALIHHPRSPR